MKSKILATVIYNIVLWGMFVLINIIFSLDLSGAAFFLYPVCMPVLFQAICIAVFPVEKIEIIRHVFEVFVQILIVIAFYVIIYFCIDSVFGDWSFMKSGGTVSFRAFGQGLLSTFSFIVIMIVDAFLIKRKIWRFRLLSVFALIIFFYSLLLEGFRVMSFMIFVVISALMIKCEDK